MIVAGLVASESLRGDEAAGEESPAPKTNGSTPAKVIIIPIRAQIAKPELYIIRRGLREAISGNAQGIILDMKTPGGSAAVTLEIMESLDRYSGRKLTYVNDEAGSAGAIIASVTEEIYFYPTGVMGAAELIFGSGQDVGEGLKRKMNSFLSAKIRAFANDQPMRADVIKAMMDPEFEFKIGDEVIKAKGELLTLTAKEAVRTFGDPPMPLLAAGIAETIDEIVEREFGAGVEIVHFKVTWSERLAQYITAFTPILLGIGMLGLFVEFKTPGFGVFGFAGIVLLGIVFFGHYVAGLSGHEPALLFVLGLLLVAIELFFFPGTMVMAISGIALMLGSLVWAMADLWPGEPVSLEGDILLRPMANVLAGVLLAVVVFLAILKFLPKGGPWGRLVLETVVGGEPGPPHALITGGPDEPSAASLVGQAGVAATALFPSGQVDISGRRYEARLDMGVADRGTPLRVTGISEFGLIVEVAS